MGDDPTKARCDRLEGVGLPQVRKVVKISNESLPRKRGYMKDYRRQNGCWNCTFVFVRSDYEEGNHRYCTFGTTRPALCGSVAMDESFFSLPSTDHYVERPDAEAEEAMKAWDEWAKKHEVDSFGCCPTWTEAK